MKVIAKGPSLDALHDWMMLARKVGTLRKARNDLQRRISLRSWWRDLLIPGEIPDAGDRDGELLIEEIDRALLVGGRSADIAVILSGALAPGSGLGMGIWGCARGRNDQDGRRCWRVKGMVGRGKIEPPPQLFIPPRVSNGRSARNFAGWSVMGDGHENMQFPLT